MKLKTLFKGAQWANTLVLLGTILNQAAGVLPALNASPKFLVAQLAVQTAIGIFLPGIGGVAHQMAFGTPQDPNPGK